MTLSDEDRCASAVIQMVTAGIAHGDRAAHAILTIRDSTVARCHDPVNAERLILTGLVHVASGVVLSTATRHTGGQVTTEQVRARLAELDQLIREGR